MVILSLSFTLTELANYREFFKQMLHEILTNCASQNIFTVEIRHTCGMLFDENRKQVAIQEELKIFQD